MAEMTRTPQRPNLILIVLDCVRAQNMGLYGYQRPTTPHLDRFGRENIYFQHMFSPATWTIPTHASMLSGLYLSQHRIENVKADRAFNLEITPLPQALRQHGYRTMAFSQNILFSPEHHFNGFDEFHMMDGLYQKRPFPRLVNQIAESGKGKLNQAARYMRKNISLRLTLDAMRDTIQKQRSDQPFFMMTNISNAHYPWAPPIDLLFSEMGLGFHHLFNSEYNTMKPWIYNAGRRHLTPKHREIWLKMYDASLRHVDREMGRFLNAMQSWSGWDNTILAITADHGELVGDYRDLVGHMLCLNDKLVHVPMLLHHPGFDRQQAVKGVVQSTDIFPSFLEWAQVPTDTIPRTQLQRPSLTDALNTPDHTGGFAIAEEDYTDSYDVPKGLLKVNPQMDPAKFPRRQVMVRSATHKYIWRDDGPGELYDLTRDPQEQHNLIGDLQNHNGETLVALQQALTNWQSQLEIFPPLPTEKLLTMDDATLDRLRALGYVA